ncbi:CGNR zinc finger domain-containing protein [Streptomyces sp. NPDC051051]|uniref:CGNR zinc finger domain-containing protein n=1 Tax=Streptomyces sp. NPDC051051 TaxID=3155666 RepID=UPI0034387C32
MKETAPAVTVPAEAASPVLPPAPGAEQHAALAFANSAITLPGNQFVDLLGTPAGANQWLVDHGLAPVGAGLQEVCAARMRSLRDHVRDLLASHVSGEPAPAAALTAVNDALTRVPTASPLSWAPDQGLHRTPPHPVNQIVDQALGILAASAADLLTGPDAERLTACGSTPCNRYLLRAGRRHWCSVRCGDRARAARARRPQPATD